MATAREKTLRKMLTKKAGPHGWLAAADMIEEDGVDSSALRRMAELTLAIVNAVQDANRTEGHVTFRYVSLGGEAMLHLRGKAILIVGAMVGDEDTGDQAYYQRDQLCRADYVQRKAFKMAKSIMWSTRLRSASAMRRTRP